MQAFLAGFDQCVKLLAAIYFLTRNALVPPKVRPFHKRIIERRLLRRQGANFARGCNQTAPRFITPHEKSEAGSRQPRSNCQFLRELLYLFSISPLPP